MGHRDQKSTLWLIGLAVFVVDRLTKWLTDALLPVMSEFLSIYPYGGVGVFENFFGIQFSLSHATNTGAAWGVFSQGQTYLILFRLALVGGLGVCLLRRVCRAWDFPLTLILAGALGNVVDYFVYGHVVDMFHFVFWGYHFPVFNVADSSIFLGVSWIVLLSFSADRAKRRVPS